MNAYVLYVTQFAQLVRCFGYALLRGKATRKQIPPKKVLIIQTAKMGDMVCTTPMFRAIKKAYPEAQVYAAGDAVNNMLLAGHPDVDGYVLWQKDVSVFEAEVRKLNFDFACVTTPNAAALAAVFLAGVPCIAVPHVTGGWSALETKSYRLMRKLVCVVPHHMGSYAPREYLRLLEPLNINETDTSKHLSYSIEAREKVIAFLQAQNLTTQQFCIISPSAGNKIKRWPSERFARVAEFVAQRYMPVVFIGGPKDTVEVAETIAAVVPLAEKIIDASGQFTIDELKALIAHAGLFVSVDTGPLYVAEAFDVPTIDIVGPMDEREQPPIGKRHVVIVPTREKAELHIMNARVYNEREAQRQAEATTVKEVTDAVESLLS